jgi:hypothetical protein
MLEDPLMADFPCLRPCAIVHEETHRRDALRMNPNVCRGMPDRTGVNFTEKERIVTEKNAHTAELKCYNDSLRDKSCPKKCEGDVKDRAGEVGGQLLPYYRSGQNPYQSNPYYKK